MSNLKISVLRCVAVGAAFLSCTTALAAGAPAVFLTADFNKDVVRVNFECEIPGECGMLEERINEQNLYLPQAVEVGLRNGRTFALISSGTFHNRKIDLFTANEPGQFWDKVNFDNARGDAIALTQDSTVYVVSKQHLRSQLYKYAPEMCNGVERACWGLQSPVLEVMVGNYRCLKVADLTEYPAGSGNLLATCKFPQAAVLINPDSGQQTTIIDPHSFPLAPTGAGAANVDGEEYLLFSTVYRKVLAYRRDGTNWVRQQKPVLRLRGYLGGIATGRCTDGGACASVSNSGNRGRLNLVALAHESGNLVGEIREIANNDLAFPGNGTFSNVTTTTGADCTDDDGCVVGVSTLFVENLPDDAIVGGEVLGIYPDSRFDPQNGVCLPGRLDLEAATGIAELAGRYVGPEFCAKIDGQFFLEKITVDTPLAEGTVELIADGPCFATGFTPGLDPTITLEETNFGLRDADAPDRFASDDDEVNDTLFDCTNPRRRGGASLSFYFEGFYGRPEFNVDAPAVLLYAYGDKVLDEAIDNLDSETSCSTTGTDACVRVREELSQAKVGWDLQDNALDSELVVMNGSYVNGGVMQTLLDAIPGTGVDLTVTASGGDLGFFSITDSMQVTYRALGVGGEINVGQALSFTASSDLTGTAVDNVPFRVPSFTIVALFDGPEFGDVEELMQVTGTREDGSTVVGGLQILFDDNPTWLGPGSPTITTLSPAVQGDAAVYRVENPFPGEDFVRLEFAPQNVNYDPGTCPTGPNGCTNQSDGAVLDLEIQVIDRVDALKFAYDGLLASLCDTSTRTGGRPPASICTNGGPFVSDFNSPGKNVAGSLQIFGESFARFVTQNICRLSMDDPDFDPTFCEIPQPWSDIAP